MDCKSTIENFYFVKRLIQNHIIKKYERILRFLSISDFETICKVDLEDIGFTK